MVEEEEEEEGGAEVWTELVEDWSNKCLDKLGTMTAFPLASQHEDST